MTTKLSLLALGTLASLALACAHEPSADLVTARHLYNEAAQGPANEVASADVYEAKKALDKAEALEGRKQGSVKEQDLAYVAARRSQYAMARADMKTAQSDEREAVATRTRTLEEQRDTSNRRLAATAEKLSDKERALAEKEEALAKAEARQAALRTRLDTAMASLSEIAQLKEEQGKMVITLSGSVLFKTDSTKLLPSAQRKLAEVAQVLREYDDSSSITVEGHTDARGGADYNATLSLQRAQSVERFLEGEGVEDSAVKAVGRGETEPVANNKTAEGRANNRRVEIVIDRNSVAMR